MYEIYFNTLENDILPGILLLENELDFRVVKDKKYGYIQCDIIPHDHGLKVDIKENRCTIYYQKKVEVYRGIGLFIEHLRDGPNEICIEEVPRFEQLIYMHDSSRNGVANPRYIKSLIIRLALMGYNAVMIYTEDTFEIEGEPYFGHYRGRYSSDELTDIDNYAFGFGIEMIPCIQTLAHLNAIFRWKTYEDIHDIKDILLCGEEKTYALIEKMILTYKKTFRSRNINIGMDEAEMMGLGKYLVREGFKDRSILMKDHLDRILELCRKHGYKTMMWSDMFFKLKGSRGYYEALSDDDSYFDVPSDTTLIYWDYYSRNETTYSQIISEHLKITDNCAFAGGAWKWGGYAPLMSHSLQVGLLALNQCSRHNLKTVIVTAWGDDGNEAASVVSYPVLQMYAEYTYHHNVKKDHLNKRFKTCVDASFEDFLLMEQLNFTPDNPLPGGISVLPSKYFFYQDPLLGIYDKHAEDESLKKHFETISLALEKASKHNLRYQYAFRTLSELSRVLSQKYNLGIRMQRAYINEERSQLIKIMGEIIEICANIEIFHECVRKQWTHENKIFGLEVLDIRIAGIIARLKISYKTLDDYLEGKIDSVPELEIDRLYHGFKEDGSVLPLYQSDWKTIVTCSVI